MREQSGQTTVFHRMKPLIPMYLGPRVGNALESLAAGMGEDDRRRIPAAVWATRNEAAYCTSRNGMLSEQPR